MLYATPNLFSQLKHPTTESLALLPANEVRPCSKYLNPCRSLELLCSETMPPSKYLV